MTGVIRRNRNRTIAVAVGTALLGISVSASAQTGAAAPSAPERSSARLEEIVVIGSNIRRSEMEQTVPVTVLGEEAIEVRGAVLPVELLTSLPSVVNLPENETRLGSSGARGDNANLNLRDMGATATLVLLNGRRLAINPMTAGLSQAVNVNHLPTHAIERVEVLRDGASSIYGSDAVGGVINYVMRREFEGIETTLRYGYPEAGGGKSTLGALTFGSAFAGDRGRYIGSVEALYRDSIKLSDREFSRTSFTADRAPPPFDQPGGAFDGRTPRGFWPTFRIGDGTGNNFFRPVDGVPTLTGVAPNRVDNPEFFLDLNQFGLASPRVRRGNVYFAGEFDLTDAVTAFTELGYYTAVSTMRRQPLALNAPTSDPLIVMPVDSPYNPYGSRFFHPEGAPNPDGSPRLVGTPTTISFTQMTLADLAPEQIETDNDAVRAAVGLKGQFGSTWGWESSLFFNQVKGRDEAFPDVRDSLLLAATARTDDSAYNPFGYTFRIEDGAVVADQPFTNPAAVVDSFTDVFARSARSQIFSADLRADGVLFPLWGSEVLAAVGAEYRREDLKDVRPPFSGENPPESGLDPNNNDFLLHPPRPDVFGDRNVTSLYAEVLIPLVDDHRSIPLVESLDITASARYEDYSDFGTALKPKIGANWRPAPWLMVRGSYNEGFQAPSLAALNTSFRWTITAGAGTIDTYRNPFLNEGPYVKRTYFGGNPGLKAQESKGTTFGFVLDVPFVSGLSFSADYWRIRRTNLLGQRSVAQINASDTALLLAYTQSQLAAGVPIDQIDLGSGTPNYRGDPDVERFPLTPEDIAAFADYNAANPDNPAAPAGRIFRRDRPFLNLASSEHRGVDFGFRYDLPGLPWGDFAIQSDWAYLARSRRVLAPANVEPTLFNDMYTGGASRIRSTTNVFWQRGGWNAGLGIYHVGKTHDGATTSEAVWESLGRPSYIEPHVTGGRTIYRLVIGSVVTYNASLGYRFGSDAGGWLRDTRVRLGIANLTDRAPPLSSANFGYDPSVSQNLLAGRTWSMELRRRF